MSRSARQTPGGYVYHVLNRANARLRLFAKPPDYNTFLGVVDEALEKHPCRVLAYCVLPTHWHFVLWPQGDQDLSAFLRWLTLTHAIRWQTRHHCVGSGHVYQNRFKAFPVQADAHLHAVVRYVEQNPPAPAWCSVPAIGPGPVWGAGWRAARPRSDCTPGRCLSRSTGWPVWTSR